MQATSQTCNTSKKPGARLFSTARAGRSTAVVLAVFLLTGARAANGEALSGRLAASVHAGYSQAAIGTSVSPDTTGGFAAGLQFSWAWSDSFAITAAGELGLHPDHQFTQPDDGSGDTQGPEVRDLRTYGFLVGLTYFIDIFDVVPFITAGGCADWYIQEMSFPALSGPPKLVPQSGMELGVAAEGGLEVRISPHLFAALAARLSTYLTDSSYYEGKTAVFFRMTYRLDARNLWPWGRDG